MKIIAETAELIVVDKPHGWLTTPARLPDDPRPVLGLRLQEQLGVQIFPVHRLDFEVSGLTLWAKTPGAHRAAQAWFEHEQIAKLYEGLSLAGAGEPPPEWLAWHSSLVRGKRRSFSAPHGKDARTRARARREDRLWRWQLMPLTGRPHQLRVEMASHGFALLGDTLYGGLEMPEPDWIALRAVELSLAQIPVADRFGLPEVLRASPLTLPFALPASVR